MNIDDVVRELTTREIPVLASTAADLRALRRNEEKVSAREIARVVLRDPLMTLKVLRFAATHRGPRQLADITTVEHAIMMHGITNFLASFATVTTLEAELEGNPEACRGAHEVISRSQHAAEFARAIAFRRHDVESEEIVVSALLHDLAELLLWFHDPRAELELNYLVDHARGVRSASAQRIVLGFTHVELQLALTKAWTLPDLLRRLMDDLHVDHPRVVNVVVSAALSRHLSHGWNDPALPDDYKAIEKLLAIGPETAQRLVRNSSLAAARLWTTTGVRPVAAWLPMDAGEVPAKETVLRRPPTVDLPVLRRGLARLQMAPAAADEDALVAWTLWIIAFGLGLPRVLFAAVAPDRQSAAIRFSLDADNPENHWCLGMSIGLGGRDLFSKLMEKMQGVWAGGANKAKLISHLTPEQRRCLEDQDFLAMSIFNQEQPVGLILAAPAVGNDAVPEALYSPFKAVCTTLAKRLGRTGHE